MFFQFFFVKAHNSHMATINIWKPADISQKKVCLKTFSIIIYSRTRVIRILRGPRNLFALYDYSNYRVSIHDREI